MSIWIWVKIRTACFSLWFHLPGFHFEYLLLTNSDLSLSSPGQLLCPRNPRSHPSPPSRYERHAMAWPRGSGAQAPPVVFPFYRFFFGGGFPTKIDYRKKGTLISTSLLEDLGLVRETERGNHVTSLHRGVTWLCVTGVTQRLALETRPEMSTIKHTHTEEQF